ncbi:hypothetical protein BKN38_03645 [Helicobacter sp. CLO-3]|nr:hypothetical protein BA723_07795 [Helicobacter sp. CLO-3]OHU84132.1 hypothetical protein BKN38_03645 [Helicobacter sp. CLO-3]
MRSFWLLRFVLGLWRALAFIWCFYANSIKLYRARNFSNIFMKKYLASKCKTRFWLIKLIYL